MWVHDTTAWRVLGLRMEETASRLKLNETFPDAVYRCPPFLLYAEYTGTII